MLKIGLITLHIYGFLIGLGILCATSVASKVFKILGGNSEKIWNNLIWVVFGGLVGARIYHVLDYWSYYSQHLKEILFIWNGGLGIFGGIFGGGIVLWFIYKIKFEVRNFEFYRILDAVVVGLPLGQAIGRWGNFFNQEVYGKPTDLFWGIYIKPKNRLLEVMQYEKFHPLFLYESLWSLIIFGLLWYLVVKKRIKTGGGVVTYLGLYGLGRFFLEFLRIESWVFYGVNVAQIIGMLFVFLMCWWWFNLDSRK